MTQRPQSLEMLEMFVSLAQRYCLHQIRRVYRKQLGSHDEIFPEF